MILLDTNVISEIIGNHKNIDVLEWISAQDTKQLYTSRIVQAEILYGIELLPNGKKRQGLESGVELCFQRQFKDHTVDVTEQTVHLYAQLAAQLKKNGDNIGMADILIAAQALEHDATIATRNTKHFELCRAKVVNPFS